MLAGLLAASGVALPASAAECTLATAPSGIAFCDTREGTGKEPVKGSLIRFAALCSMLHLSNFLLASGLCVDQRCLCLSMHCPWLKPLQSVYSNALKR